MVKRLKTPSLYGRLIQIWGGGERVVVCYTDTYVSSRILTFNGN